MTVESMPLLRVANLGVVVHDKPLLHDVKFSRCSVPTVRVRARSLPLLPANFLHTADALSSTALPLRRER
jgi:hypothetical protein